MQLKHLLAAGLAPAMASARALRHRSVECYFSTAVESGTTCASLADGWALSVNDLIKLNPGITCAGLDLSKEYCVMGTATDDVPLTTSTTSTTSSQSSTTSTQSSTQSSTTSTQSSTQSSTTTSTQSLTTTSTKSSTTSTQSSITSTQSSTTSTKSSTITTTTPTTTLATNGVTTPTPTQTGMVGNCNKFHFVEQGQTCATIAALYSISTAQFTTWNPAANSDCTGLWASTYACVGIIGGTPTTPTATVGANGVSTPLPTQSGMVTNCNKFFKVNAGDMCNSIAFFNGPISTENFVLWNAGVGGLQCTNLQAGTYACIGVIQATPTATVGANGVSTPLPTQSGMVTNCNKFYKVNAGDTCNSVAFFNGPISTENFVLWNAGVGGLQCNKLQAGAYACIAVKV